MFYFDICGGRAAVLQQSILRPRFCSAMLTSEVISNEILRRGPIFVSYINFTASDMRRWFLLFKQIRSPIIVCLYFRNFKTVTFNRSPRDNYVVEEYSLLSSVGPMKTKTFGARFSSMNRNNDILPCKRGFVYHVKLYFASAHYFLYK